MAVQSMTGYGSAEFQLRGKTYLVEIKTVNHRYLKISSRFAELYNPIQFELEGLVKEHIARGSVTLYIRESRLEGDSPYEISETVLLEYWQKIQSIGQRHELEWRGGLEHLLSLPGVVVSKRNGELLDEELSQALKQAFSRALKRTLAMRRREGKVLERELRGYLREIQKLLRQVEKNVPVAREEFQNKLEERLQRILQKRNVSITDEVIVREVAVYAEKMDIEEELLRMRSHIAQFREALRSEAPLGRRLEFLAQEMVREANTMGAKTTHLPTLTLVMEMKNLVDKIKEQVQNIE